MLIVTFIIILLNVSMPSAMAPKFVKICWLYQQISSEKLASYKVAMTFCITTLSIMTISTTI
jgi:hypothetical protein